MKLFRLTGVSFLLLAAMPAAFSQAKIYATVSASKLTNLVGTNVLYGPTIGISANVARRGGLDLSLDVRASFAGGSMRLDGVELGPNVGFHIRRYVVYGGALVGFARYNDGLGNPASASTDSQIDVIAGVDRRVSDRLDWRVFDYDYKQYYGLGGQFNPKTFSTGVVVHLGRR